MQTRAQTANAPLHTRLMATAATPQDASPLFCIPAEIRSHIIKLALTDYATPSSSRQYDQDNCYARPSYFAPRRNDTELLRTCRAIYAESWHLPFLLKEQTHWLASQDRIPPEYHDFRNVFRLERQVQQIGNQLGEDVVEIDSLRVFAQMYRIEDGSLAKLCEIPRLAFRSLTLTIRHADWWFWESDQPLRFEGSWMERFCRSLPETVQEIHIELETLERKKDQVEAIAKLMSERWFFKTQGGKILFADSKGVDRETTRWRGSSTWNRQRWVRDETEEGKIDYYVLSVPFRTERILDRKGGTVGEEAKRLAGLQEFDREKMKLHLPPGQKRLSDPSPFWTTSQGFSHDDFESEEEDVYDWVE